MKLIRRSNYLAVTALTLIVAGTAIGQTNNMNSTQNYNTNSKMAPDGTFSNWMTDQSRTSNGYVSRDEYMREAGRRWDTADKNHRGLTLAEINQVYGYGSSAAAATRTPDKIEGNQAPAVGGPTK